MRIQEACDRKLEKKRTRRSAGAHRFLRDDERAIKNGREGILKKFDIFNKNKTGGVLIEDVGPEPDLPDPQILHSYVPASRAPEHEIIRMDEIINNMNNPHTPVVFLNLTKGHKLKAVADSGAVISAMSSATYYDILKMCP